MILGKLLHFSYLSFPLLVSRRPVSTLPPLPPPSPRGFWWGPGERLGGGARASVFMSKAPSVLRRPGGLSASPCAERRAPLSLYGSSSG